MKNVRRLASLILAIVMVLAMATTAFAEDAATTGSITIEKAVTGETYTIVKLFDAAVGANGNITYTGTIPTALATYFTVDNNGYISATDAAKDEKGELSSAAVSDIKTWAETQDGTSQTAASDGNLVFSDVAYGYYVITTTQGAVISVDSTNPNATVQNKNTAPELAKKITGATDYDEAGNNAIEQVGQDVTYQSTITVGKGAKNYVYHDTMESSLSFKSDSVKVTLNGSPVADSSYSVTTNVAHGEGEATETHTFDVDFTDAFEATLKEDDKIVIEYKATVTSDALQTDPANNTAYVSYGQAGETIKDSTSVYNAKFSVTKTDGNNQPLAGAGFVIAKSVADTSEGAEEGATKNLYYTLSNGVVTWVENIDDADEHTSDAQGNVAAFTGLTVGTYTLIEKTVPAGYNKAADQSFTVAEDTYTEANLVQSATVVNQSGSELPSTGGMGTTLFYIVGGLMVAAAAVLLVTKKRMSSEA